MSGPLYEPFLISVESEAVKTQDKYLSKDVTTLNFNNNFLLISDARTAVTPLCILNSQKINLGVNIFLPSIPSMLSFSLLMSLQV